MKRERRVTQKYIISYNNVIYITTLDMQTARSENSYGEENIFAWNNVRIWRAGWHTPAQKSNE